MPRCRAGVGTELADDSLARAGVPQDRLPASDGVERLSWKGSGVKFSPPPGVRAGMSRANSGRAAALGRTASPTLAFLGAFDVCRWRCRRVQARWSSWVHASMMERARADLGPTVGKKPRTWLRCQ